MVNLWIKYLGHLTEEQNIIRNEPTINPLIQTISHCLMSWADNFSFPVVQKKEILALHLTPCLMNNTHSLSSSVRLDWQCYSFKSYLYTFVPVTLYISNFIHTFHTLFFFFYTEYINVWYLKYFPPTHSPVMTTAFLSASLQYELLLTLSQAHMLQFQYSESDMSIWTEDSWSAVLPGFFSFLVWDIDN